MGALALGGAALGAASGIAGAFDKGGDPELISIVRNPEVDRQIRRQLGTSDETLNLQESNLADFGRRFRQQTPDVERFTREGVRDIEDLFGGQTEQNLRGLRARRRGARASATQRALDRIQQANQRLRARRGIVGGNTFQDLQFARLARDAEIDASLEDTEQERADFGFLLQQRLGNALTRQQLLDTLLNRSIQPTLARGQVQGSTLNTLRSIAETDRANRVEGLQQEPTTLGRIASAGRAIGGGLLNVGAIGTVLGGGGGGGLFGRGIPRNPFPLSPSGTPIPGVTPGF